MKMRKSIIAVVTVMVLLLGTGGAYAQQGINGVSSLPGGGWWEASLVMNASDSDATVTFTPISAADSTDEADPVDVTIEAGASLNFMPGQYGNMPSMDSGYKGSAVVSADQPIVAIGSVANNPIGDIGVTGGRAAAQYPGISQDSVAQALYFPVVKSDYKGKTTTFFIQTVTPGEVTVVYTMNDGANTYTESKTTTKAGEMLTFTPADAPDMPETCTDATCLGAATFTAPVDMAGVYVENNTSEVPAQILLSTRGFTAGDFGTTVVNPVIKSLWKGRTTGVQIMNVSSVASTITLTLAYADGSATGADGQSVVFSDVAQGASVTFFPGNHGIFGGPYGGGDADEFTGAATITSDQDMVAIVNENDFAAAATTKQTVFACFPQTAGTDTVLFPLVKEFYSGNTTGVQIMNVGSSAVTLSAEYVFQSNSFTVAEDAAGATITIDPGAAFTFWGVTDYWNGDFDAYTNDYGAVKVTATGGEIVGIAQEAAWGGGTLDTKNYEGFNQ